MERDEDLSKRIIKKYGLGSSPKRAKIIEYLVKRKRAQMGTATDPIVLAEQIDQLGEYIEDNLVVCDRGLIEEYNAAQLIEYESTKRIGSLPTIECGMNGCPEKFTLYWLEQQLLDASEFAVEALQKLHDIEKQQPEKYRSTYTTASSATELINHWLVQRDLIAYQRGKPIDDFAALPVEPIECDLTDAMELLQSSINIKRDELVQLIQRNGMTVPEFLQSQPAKAGSLYQRTEAYFSPNSASDPRTAAENEASAAARHSVGRYTLQEAAYFIGTEAGERPKELLEKLKLAVNSGALAAYEPGKNQKYRFGPGTVVREWYEEVFWDELNEWLEANETKIRFRFDPPSHFIRSTEQTNSESNSGEARVAWRITLFDKIEEIDKAHGGKATVQEAIRWLKKNGGKRITDDGDSDELNWVDDNGTRQTVKKKTVSTALSLARKAKGIPV